MYVMYTNVESYIMIMRTDIMIMKMERLMMITLDVLSGATSLVSLIIMISLIMATGVGIGIVQLIAVLAPIPGILLPIAGLLQRHGYKHRSVPFVLCAITFLAVLVLCVLLFFPF